MYIKEKYSVLKVLGNLGVSPWLCRNRKSRNASIIMSLAFEQRKKGGF